MASFDGIWEEIYSQGRQLNRYPWTDVVSFVFHNKPDRERADIRVLEVGCGSAPNIAFLAAEGFQAFGVDASPTAIQAGRALLAKHGLSAELSIGDFTALSYDDGSFDLVIDRAALTHSDHASVTRAIGEIRRVLKPGGRFLFTPFGDSNTSFAKGVMGPDLTSRGIAGGGLHEVGQVTFVSRKEIAGWFREGWVLRQCVRREDVDLLSGSGLVSQWLVVAEKS